MPQSTYIETIHGIWLTTNRLAAVVKTYVTLFVPRVTTYRDITRKTSKHFMESVADNRPINAAVKA